MAYVSPANIKFYLSGGADNTEQADSIGGARSTSTVAQVAGLFRTVRKSTTYYRCLYVRNEDANANGWDSIYMWLSTATPVTDVAIAIGKGAAAKNGTETPIADEHTAPAGVTFTSPVTKATGIALPDLDQNDFQAIWLRVTVGASPAYGAPVSFTLELEGTSTA